jgi:hypothetical protein
VSTEAQARAATILPDWPDDCRRKEPHAALTVGEDVRSILRRERYHLDLQNARTARCGDFYADLKAGLAGKP